MSDVSCEAIRATEPGVTIHSPSQVNGPKRDTSKPEMETRYGGKSSGPPFYFDINAGVYVLECANSTYYVGMSWNLEQRMTSHFSGKGAMWTQQNPPQRVEKVLTAEGCAREYGSMRLAEDQITIEYMSEHGAENVRGGSWVHTELDKCPQLPTALHEEENKAPLHERVENILQ